MANVTIRFLHPTNGGSVEAEVDDEMTATETVAELTRANFLPPGYDGWQLWIKGGAQIQPGQTLRAAGVRDGGEVRVVGQIEGAGGSRHATE